MDWEAFWLTIRLGGLTVLLLIPAAILTGRWLAATRMRGRALSKRGWHCRWYCRRRLSAST